YAAENGIDPLLIYALIREESRFNEEAISIAGAIGLMQIMPQTAATIMNDTYGGRDTLFSPELNIALGTRFFAELLKRYKGNFILALAGYNAGPHIVSKWLEDREGLGVDEFIEDIPYKETREYVKRVFKSYMKYSLSLKPIHTVSPPLIQSGLEGADVIDTQE
ncbi:MAG TPA: lytic transglycosylase, partial [Nitrospiraceae bacterium]|nr:lytic transglycosylase [Nitrospiraceae bacterium]